MKDKPLGLSIAGKAVNQTGVEHGRGHVRKIAHGPEDGIVIRLPDLVFALTEGAHQVAAFPRNESSSTCTNLNLKNYCESCVA